MELCEVRIVYSVQVHRVLQTPMKCHTMLERPVEGRQCFEKNPSNRVGKCNGIECVYTNTWLRCIAFLSCATGRRVRIILPRLNLHGLLLIRLLKQIYIHSTMSSSDDEAPEEVSKQHGEAGASESRRSERDGKRAASQQLKQLRSSRRQPEGAAAASFKATEASDGAGKARASEAEAEAAGSSKKASKKKQRTQEPAETVAAAEVDSEEEEEAGEDLLPESVIAAVAVNAAEKLQHQRLLAQAVLEGQETAKQAEQRRRKRERRAATKLAQSKGIGKIAVKVLGDVAKEGRGGLAGNFLKQAIMDSSRPRSINMIKPGLRGLQPAARFA